MLPFTFITHWGFHTLILAHMLDSLVRVSRRDVSLHFAKVPNSKRLLLASIAKLITSIASYPSNESNETPIDPQGML
jgi:hypothetical protein